jgi:hypothetical protein
MTFNFSPATKAKSKARIALVGPAGSGKTYTALQLATYFGGPIAVVDSERGSAAKYSGQDGFAFDVLELGHFDPRTFPALLAAAAPVCGTGTLIIDSLTAWWSGLGGMQEFVDEEAKRSKSGNSFQAWGTVRPHEKRMLDGLLSFPGHVIVTMRTKTAYEIIEDSRGKKVPTKIGLAPEQRAGIEYEFDVVGDMDMRNDLVVSKSRCSAATRKGVYPHPGKDLASDLLAWLTDGVEAAAPKPLAQTIPSADTESTVAALREKLVAASTLAELDRVRADLSAAIGRGELTKKTVVELGEFGKKRRNEMSKGGGSQ